MHRKFHLLATAGAAALLCSTDAGIEAAGGGNQSETKPRAQPDTGIKVWPILQSFTGEIEQLAMQVAVPIAETAVSAVFRANPGLSAFAGIAQALLAAGEQWAENAIHPNTAVTAVSHAVHRHQAQAGL